LKDIIDNKINSREFTFMELLKIDKLAEDLANETYEELTTQQRLDFAWEVKITTTGSTFGTLFRSATITSLRTAFSEALKEFMENAKVTSQSESKTRIMTSFEPPEFDEEASTAELKTMRDEDDLTVERESDKKTTTFETGSDGIALPKGVKRIE
jgi:hypothetical protein